MVVPLRGFRSDPSNSKDLQWTWDILARCTGSEWRRHNLVPFPWFGEDRYSNSLFLTVETCWLLLPAHSSTLLSSWIRLAMLLAGITESTSSANLNMRFPEVIEWRPATSNKPGLMLDPWMMLADMSTNSDFSSARSSGESGHRGRIRSNYRRSLACQVWSFSLWRCSVSPCRTLHWSRAWWRPHMDLSGVVHRWHASSDMSAAVVEPPGLKANWSCNDSCCGGGFSRAE